MFTQKNFFPFVILPLTIAKEMKRNKNNATIETFQFLNETIYDQRLSDAFSVTEISIAPEHIFE